MGLRCSPAGQDRPQGPEEAPAISKGPESAAPGDPPRPQRSHGTWKVSESPRDSDRTPSDPERTQVSLRTGPGTRKDALEHDLEVLEEPNLQEPWNNWGHPQHTWSSSSSTKTSTWRPREQPQQCTNSLERALEHPQRHMDGLNYPIYRFETPSAALKTPSVPLGALGSPASLQKQQASPQKEHWRIHSSSEPSKGHPETPEKPQSSPKHT